jgi:hypothetical protein
MRIHEGKYAYDLEQLRDPQTQVRSHWRYKVYEVRPVEKVLASGEAESQTEAEKQAKNAIARLAEKERRPAA